MFVLIRPGNKLHHVRKALFDCWMLSLESALGSPTINSGVSSVAFSVDGDGIVSVSGDGVVRIWDACLGTESKERSSRSSGLVTGVAISTNGLQVVSSSGSGTVQLWDALTGEQIGAD